MRIKVGGVVCKHTLVMYVTEYMRRARRTRRTSTLAQGQRWRLTTSSRGTDAGHASDAVAEALAICLLSV